MELTGRLRHALGPLIALLLMAYFGYHIVQGERGLFSWMRLRQKITNSQEQLTKLQSEKEILERRVGLLRPDSLDQDMLEQRAREVLNLGHPDEVVIYDDVPNSSVPSEKENIAKP